MFMHVGVCAHVGEGCSSVSGRINKKWAVWVASRKGNGWPAEEQGREASQRVHFGAFEF